MAAIIIVFPDYQIQTGILGIRVPYLGHAGILLINDRTGLTRYYEYGRYDTGTEIGLVRRQSIPNIRIGRNGLPTDASLDIVFRRLSRSSGHNGRIEGVFVRTSMYDEMVRYAEQRMSQNRNPHRQPYAISGLGVGVWHSVTGLVDTAIASNIQNRNTITELENDNCGTFAIRVASQDPAFVSASPVLYVRRPTNIIEEYESAGFEIIRYPRIVAR